MITISRKGATPFSLEARAAVKDLGLTDDTLHGIVRRAVPYTHPQANRRSGSYLLLVVNGVVQRFWAQDDALECRKKPPVRQRGSVMEMLGSELRECPVCHDDGGHCRECEGTGQVLLTQAGYDALCAQVLI
jgi:hypothetical protein